MEPRSEEILIKTSEIVRVSQPRRRSWGDIDGLAASIAAVGQTTAAVVRRVSRGANAPQEMVYELVSGERRFLACEKLGRDLLCVVRVMSDDDAHMARIVENAHREDLSPMEEAEAFGEAISLFGRTIDDIAARIGRDAVYVRRRLAILSMDPTIAKWASDGVVGLDAALLVAQTPEPVQQRVRDDLQRMLKSAPGGRLTRAAVASALDGVRADLQFAPFDVADPTLVPSAGPCTTCRQRTGAQGALFEILESDSCINLPCHDAKRDAATERKLEAAKKAGLLVLDAEKSEKALEYGSEYVGLDEAAYYLDSEGNPTESSGTWSEADDAYVEHTKVTFRSLLGEDTKPIVARDPRSGKAVELGMRSMADQALHAILPRTTVSEHGRVKPDPREKAARKKARDAEKAHQLGMDRAILALGEATEKEPSDAEAFRAFFVGVLGLVHHETLRYVCRIRGWSLDDVATGAKLAPKEVVIRESADMAPPSLSRVLVEVVASAGREALDNGIKGTAIEALFKARGVNLKHHRRQAELEIQGLSEPKRRAGKKGGKAKKGAEAGAADAAEVADAG
jgi:ParB/RepB/Spo0J family partition protein